MASTMRAGIVALWAALWPGPCPAAPSYEVLASFERPGTQVVAPLVRHSSGDYFGTASAGGANGRGAVFKIGLDGTLSTLFSFSGVDGQGPAAGLVEGGDGALYGTTSSGGSGNLGVVFKVTTTGVFTKLVDFTGTTGAALGSVPHGLMLHSDGFFYGVTQAGGAGAAGTVFQMAADGTLNTLAEFTGTSGVRPGSVPLGPLAASGSLLYGVTQYGGASGLGVIFEVSTSGAWRTLGEFTGTAGLKPGANPAGSLILHADGALYGTTEFGGTNDFGTFFKITRGATPVHSVLRHFADPTGSQPAGMLVAGADGQLYGSTSSGGASGWGTAYKISTGGVHALLASFTGEAGAAPGASPRGGMVSGGDGLYHTVTSAGAAGNYGAAVKVAADGTFQTVAAISLPAGWMPSGAPVFSGGAFYFPMAAGGTGGGGNVMALDASGTVVVAASLGGTLGSLPDGALRQVSDGVLYGLAARGGASARGTTYRFMRDASAASLISAHTTSAGSLAEGPLVQGADGLLYGMSREGGASGRGTVFKVSTAGVRTRVVSFTGMAGAAPGARPRGPLVLAADGHFYGVTEEGGTSNAGVLFKLTSAGAYSVMVHFSGTGPRSPQGGLVAGVDGALYGTTSLGGAADAGTLIRFDPTTSTWSMAGEFAGIAGPVPGRLPGGELHVAADGAIYGITLAGGAADLGTLFRYTGAGGLEGLVAFTGSGGAAPGAASAVDGAGLALTGGVAGSVEGDLYGVLPGGGDGGGVAFRVRFSAYTAIHAWKQANLGNPDASDTDDPDQDGLPNLLEYAVGSLPLSTDVSALPQPFLINEADGDHLALSVLRDPAHNDITLVVEVSTSLAAGEWSPLATSSLGAPFSGPGMSDVDPDTPDARYVTVRDTVPISISQRRFVRLRVVH